MLIAHISLPTEDVVGTAAFFEAALALVRQPFPANSPVEGCWFQMDYGQSLHVFYVEGFVVSPFEAEFGRHLAMFAERDRLGEMKRRLRQHGAELIEPLRETEHERFFFREPVNGYVFEVIDSPRLPGQASTGSRTSCRFTPRDG